MPAFEHSITSIEAPRLDAFSTSKERPEKVRTRCAQCITGGLSCSSENQRLLESSAAKEGTQTSREPSESGESSRWLEPNGEERRPHWQKRWEACLQWGAYSSHVRWPSLWSKASSRHNTTEGLTGSLNHGDEWQSNRNTSTAVR